MFMKFMFNKIICWLNLNDALKKRESALTPFRITLDFLTCLRWLINIYKLSEGLYCNFSPRLSFLLRIFIKRTDVWSKPAS